MSARTCFVKPIAFKIPRRLWVVCLEADRADVRQLLQKVAWKLPWQRHEYMMSHKSSLLPVMPLVTIETESSGPNNSDVSPT